MTKQTKKANGTEGNGKAASKPQAKRTTKGKAEAPKGVKAAGNASQKAGKAAAANGNPYRPGSYHAAVEALRSLGVGHMHRFDKIIPAVKKAMGAEAYKAFAAKKSKMSPEEKILTNVMVVSRKDYGLPLVEKCGLFVKWDGRAKEAGLFKVGK